MLSANVSCAGKYLLEDPCSIYHQSKADPSRLQKDGWGIGYYFNGVPKVIRSEKPVYMEQDKFTKAVKTASSRVVLAHIRQASNPRKLPIKKLISIENSQPFSYKNYIFVHNGLITIPDEMAESLGEWKRRLRGLNDSEVYFWHVVKEMENGASFLEAIRRFEKMLSVIWQRVGKRRNFNHPYIGLNVLFGEGEKLYAYCRYNIEDETGLSLCLKDQNVFQMSYLLKSNSLVVASEKTSREDEWQALENKQLLVGEIAGGKIEIRLRET
jgi:predicted glutamine amidotransferase